MKKKVIGILSPSLLLSCFIVSATQAQTAEKLPDNEISEEQLLNNALDIDSFLDSVGTELVDTTSLVDGLTTPTDTPSTETLVDKTESSDTLNEESKQISSNQELKSKTKKSLNPFRSSAPVIPNDPKEASKVLYRVPGAFEYKGATVLNLKSTTVKNKFVSCKLAEDATTSRRLANLKASQGAPKFCREDVEYTIIPYRTFRRDY